MKLQELLEQQRVIKGDVRLPIKTINLNYEGLPLSNAVIKGDFDVAYTAITSLEGSPSWVGGNFYCEHTKIRSLEGSPSWVGGNYNCDHTKITSLHNIHKQIKHIGGTLTLSDTIKSNVLGVVMIKELKGILFAAATTPEQKGVANIINKHLAGDRNVHACQEELIEAGLKEFAKL